MDGFRDDFLSGAAPGSGQVGPLDDEDDNAIIEEFPVIVAQGERRLQVRAYCHWTDLLGSRSLPLIGDLRLDQLGDFAPHAVLLDLSDEQDQPRIAYVGEALATECGVARDIARLDQVPSESLLSRIIAQTPQVFADQAPVGFEAEFVNERGATILYRGMLLPFAGMGAEADARADSGTIQHVLGVINWKELADAGLSADLARQVGAAFAAADRLDVKVPAPRPPSWSRWADGPQGALDGMPRDRVVAALGSLELADVPAEIAAQMTLTDWLASARELAQAASFSGERAGVERAGPERKRQALYAAIGRAHDFALAARRDPRALAALVREAGITAQPRAPLLPLVKLVFGAAYDKTRLTEYATALTHAKRLGLERGGLARHLARMPGGLKGVLAEERRLRQAKDEQTEKGADPVWQKLAAIAPMPLASLANEGAEYALVVVRRMGDGALAALGEVDDPALLARAARNIAGRHMVGSAKLGLD